MKNFTTTFALVLLASILFSISTFAQKGMFDGPMENPLGLTKMQIGDLASCNMVDIDGDGDYDMLATNYLHSTNIYFYENIGTKDSPNFAAPVGNPFGLQNMGLGTMSPAIADIDGDGDLDIYANLKYYENIGTATAPQFAAPLTEADKPFGISGAGGNMPSFAFVDIDGDGDYDLLNTNNHIAFYYFENIGTPTAPKFDKRKDGFFGLTIRLGDTNTPLKSYFYSHPFFIDFDNDGDQDMFFGQDSGNGFLYIPNTGTATNPVFDVNNGIEKPFGLQNPNTDGQICIVDIDNDGTLDAFYGSRNRNFYWQPAYAEQ